ncbi:MAG TPA: hypothetical protein VKD89_08340 [Candidatus Udaeobacter sp.]|nr:hypothetical protein [Candidatus Udaeobacter sp.]
METISEVKSEAAELRKIVDKLDEVAIALAGINYRKKELDGQLLPPVAPISESSAWLVVEQQAVGSSPTDIRQAPNGTSPSAVLPMPHQIERSNAPSNQEIRLRAYFLSERRCRFALPGDADSDWYEAKRQLLSESGGLAGPSTITAGESGGIRRAVADVALPATVAPAKPRVESIEQGRGMCYETTFTEIQSSAAEAISEPASKFPNTVSAGLVFLQTKTLRTMPDTAQIPIAPVDKSPFAATPETPATAPTGSSVEVTFSFEITGVQLTPSFEMGALTVRPASRLVTMRLALPFQSQSAKDLQVSFEAANILPVGGTLGTLRMLPSQKQRPVANGSHSFTPAGLQVVPNFKAAPVQFTPSNPAQATIFVVVPCEMSMVEFSPLFEIASVIFKSSSKRVFVQLPGTRPGGEEGTRLCEIANLEVTESGEISTMQLHLVGPADASVT